MQTAPMQLCYERRLGRIHGESRLKDRHIGCLHLDIRRIFTTPRKAHREAMLERHTLNAARGQRSTFGPHETPYNELERTRGILRGPSPRKP